MQKIADLMKKINKKKMTMLFIIVIVIIILITIVLGLINTSKTKKCNELYLNISNVTDKYMKEQDLYPTLEGFSYTLSLNDLDKVYYKNKEVTGSVKYTKYNDTYIKTYSLDNCGYCSSKFNKESDKYNDKKKNVEVIAYYNYYDAETYNSKWTDFLEPELISSDTTMGVNLPIDSKKLPSLPSEALIIEYVKEDKTYYSYRDIMYKYYKNNVDYSDFSSEQPSGYTTKDSSTQITLPSSEWSIDYPEEHKDYRKIDSKTAYRWYYEEKGKKIYWNDGAFYPTQPDEKYDKKSKEKVTMYKFTDKAWRWYNGTLKRNYSSFSKTMPTGYIYKDSELYQYTSWSSYTDQSKLNSENATYREEVSKVYSRYLIKYKVLGFAKLDKSLTKEEFESTTGLNLSDIMNNDNMYVSVTYKFKY